MTAAESLFRRHGRLELPLSRTRENNLLALDPAHQILLDLFAAAIVSELAPVWADAVRGTALDGLPSGPSSPVQQKLLSLPEADVLQQVKTGWPLLAVGPATAPAGSSDFSIDQNRLTQRWDVDYILCPLTLGDEIRLRPVLRAVTKILRLVVNIGGHKAYRTAENQGLVYAVNVLGDNGPGSCGFYACRVAESASGPAAFAKDGPRYLAASVTLETEEISDFLDVGGMPEDGESVPLEGATLTAGLDQSGTPSLIARG